MGTIAIPILQMEKLRLRELKHLKLTHSYMATEWQRWDLDLDSLVAELFLHQLIKLFVCLFVFTKSLIVLLYFFRTIAFFCPFLPWSQLLLPLLMESPSIFLLISKYYGCKVTP